MSPVADHRDARIRRLERDLRSARQYVAILETENARLQEQLDTSAPPRWSRLHKWWKRVGP
ncbi:MAG: hypothetical protein DYH20_09335 [Gammaproteobacteria bacterium PRO9]|nr:hypothetical protein [Gammaproteobacteria bacterium PRO9]